MNLLPIRNRHVAAVLVLGALLAGCSASHHNSSPPDSAGSTKLGPGEGPVSPSASAAATRPSTERPPADLDAWPTQPATLEKFPDGVLSAAMANGYTGAKFFKDLTNK